MDIRLTLQYNGAPSELLNANSQRAQREAAQIRQETKLGHLNGMELLLQMHD